MAKNKKGSKQKKRKTVSRRIGEGAEHIGRRLAEGSDKFGKEIGDRSYEAGKYIGKKGRELRKKAYKYTSRGNPGWHGDSGRHALASYGIKTTHRVRGRANDDSKEYALRYGGHRILVTETPNAHEPYRARVDVDAYRDILTISGFYDRVVDEGSETIWTEDGYVTKRFIRYYRPDGTEIRYDYIVDGDELPSELEEYIWLDLIHIPLDEDFWTDEIPSMLSDKGDKIYSEADVLDVDSEWDMVRDFGINMNHLRLSGKFRLKSSEDAEKLRAELEA